MILTVLRSGGEYLAEHVEALRDQCARFAPGVEFRCLSDVNVPGRIEAIHDWQKWWLKIEAFRIHGPVLYLDLDTVIVGDLSTLIDVSRRKPFTVLRDFNPDKRDMGSGLMAWSGDMSGLYRTFAADPNRHIAENNSGRWLGDQGFIERHTSKSARSYWQTEIPGQVVSWKKHCKNGVPYGARVVCFHGKPRPWDVAPLDAGTHDSGQAAKPRTALILGGGQRVRGDANEALRLFTPDIVVAVNDIGADWQGRVDHWASMHSEKMPYWIAKRAGNGHKPAGTIWTAVHKANGYPYKSVVNPGGGSGALAVAVAREVGAERIVLAGMPLTSTPHFFDDVPWVSKEVMHYQKCWLRQKKDMLPFVRSVSGGFTEQHLGRPTKEWIEASYGDQDAA